MRSLYGRAFIPLLLVSVVGFAACQSRPDLSRDFRFILRGSDDDVCKEDSSDWKSVCYSGDCPTRPVNDKLITGHYAIEDPDPRSNNKRRIAKIERCYAYCMRKVSH